jgi:hypothetical protein
VFLPCASLVRSEMTRALATPGHGRSPALSDKAVRKIVCEIVIRELDRDVALRLFAEARVRGG